MGNPAGNPRNLLREQQQQLIPPLPGGQGSDRWLPLGEQQTLPTRGRNKKKPRPTGGPQGVREAPISPDSFLTSPINPNLPKISTPLVSPPEMSYGPRPERTAMLNSGIGGGGVGMLPGMGFNSGMLGQGPDQFERLGNRFPGARNEIESLRPQMGPLAAIRNRFRGLRSGIGGGGGGTQMTPLRTGRVY